MSPPPTVRINPACTVTSFPARSASEPSCDSKPALPTSLMLPVPDTGAPPLLKSAPAVRSIDQFGPATMDEPLSSIRSRPARSVSREPASESPVLSFKFQSVPLASVMSRVASSVIRAKPRKEKFTSRRKVSGKSPEPTVPLFSVSPGSEPMRMSVGSSSNAPPRQPDCALPIKVERMAGICFAETSIKPPFPPRPPPLTSSFDPEASVKARPDLISIRPPFADSASCPRASIRDSAPRFTASEAISSMTPLRSRTELAWMIPDWLTTRACSATSPASARIRPWLSTTPEGRRTSALRPRPSGRSETSTSCPANSPILPPGAARVPWFSILSETRYIEPPECVRSSP